MSIPWSVLMRISNTIGNASDEWHTAIQTLDPTSSNGTEAKYRATDVMIVGTINGNRQNETISFLCPYRPRTSE